MNRKDFFITLATLAFGCLILVGIDFIIVTNFLTPILIIILIILAIASMYGQHYYDVKKDGEYLSE